MSIYDTPACPSRNCRCSACMLRSNPERDAYYMRALTETTLKAQRRFCQATCGMSMAETVESGITWSEPL